MTVSGVPKCCRCSSRDRPDSKVALIPQVVTSPPVLLAKTVETVVPFV